MNTSLRDHFIILISSLKIYEHEIN